MESLSGQTYRITQPAAGRPAFRPALAQPAAGRPLLAQPATGHLPERKRESTASHLKASFHNHDTPNQFHRNPRPLLSSESSEPTDRSAAKLQAYVPWKPSFFFSSGSASGSRCGSGSGSRSAFCVEAEARVDLMMEAEMEPRVDVGSVAEAEVEHKWGRSGSRIESRNGTGSGSVRGSGSGSEAGAQAWS